MCVNEAENSNADISFQDLIFLEVLPFFNFFARGAQEDLANFDSKRCDTDRYVSNAFLSAEDRKQRSCKSEDMSCCKIREAALIRCLPQQTPPGIPRRVDICSVRLRHNASTLFSVVVQSAFEACGRCDVCKSAV